MDKKFLIWWRKLKTDEWTPQILNEDVFLKILHLVKVWNFEYVFYEVKIL